MRRFGEHGQMTAGRRVLYVFAAAWVLVPVIGVVHWCQGRQLPGWVVALLAAATVVSCVVLALVVLAVVEPVEREGRGPR